MDFKALPSQYDHAAAQAKWYPEWESRGYFHASVDAKDADGKPKPPFTIVIPPPNVTGALHIGHALNNTLQDILIRQKRMQGFNTLWMPGTDHAGIATQAVVERRLFEEEKKTRHDLGRAGLVERIWKWKDQYEARIISQLKAMGCSCDWERTQFTFNEHNSRAVREWFFQLFKDGKIYRGKRLVNWDTFLQTAVSDDEVFHEPTKGFFYYFRYPVLGRKNGEPEFVHIATTRPETMLGDLAVAVHPNPKAELDKNIADLEALADSKSPKKQRHFQGGVDAYEEWKSSELGRLELLRNMAADGRMLELPITRKLGPETGKPIPGTGRRIPLILDEWAKPGIGTGCVKITPAHDENDYAVWKRHPEIGAPISIMNPDGTLSREMPERFVGLKMHTIARNAIVAEMEAMELSDGKNDHEIDLPHSDRSKTPIEPYLADQWFVKMDELSQSAMDAVTGGKVAITPERYAKGYLDWLSEKRDWPIGRQLWWGHQIPIWRLGVHDVQGQCKSADELQSAFRSAFDKFAKEQGIVGDVFLTFVAAGQSALICARTTTAEDKLNKFVCAKRNTGHGGDITPDDIKNSLKSLSEAGHLLSRYVYPIDTDQEPRESDVLDTWFSSALWPHSTLGWPDETPELKTFYPTTTLITSRDIITLWVARMVLAGLYNMGDVPFHEVYITPKILDGYGETMSKSKGNGVDPIDVIEKFGADALRFGLAYLTTDTQDVKLPVDFECPHCGAQFPQTKKNRQLPRIECEKCKKPFSTQWAEKPEDKALARGAVVSERFELGRNFCNKLWNASRFSLINLEGFTPGAVADNDLLIEDRWLLSRLSTVTEQVTDFLAKYRYADAARTLYDFAWNEFCSFYIEMTKARFAPVAESLRDSDATGSRLGETRLRDQQVAQRVLAHALDTLLRLLHPMIPFLTEEVWQLLSQVAPQRGLSEPGGPPPRSGATNSGSRTTRLAGVAESICIARWPEPDKARQDATIEAQFADFQAVLGAVREIRKSQNIPFKEELFFSVRCDVATAKRLEPMQPYFTQMAKATGTAWGPNVTPPDVSASATLSGRTGPFEVHVDVSRFIDVDAERKRLEKQREEVTKFVKSIDAKLSNAAFVDKAPADVVLQQRDKRAELAAQLESVAAALKKLK